ncbi:Processing alpha glucosidase I, partial [Ceratobasidium sp. 394]
MWFGTQDYKSLPKTRHACDQGDELRSYTWTEHDMRQGAIQVLKDPLNNLELKTEWLKIPGGDHGGSWVARISGKPLDNSIVSRNSLVFYVGLEGLGGVNLETEETEDGYEGSIELAGVTPELGEFSMKFVDGPSNTYVTEGQHAEGFKRTAGKTHVIGVPVPAGHVWQAKDVLLKRIIENAQVLIKPWNDQQQTPPDPSFVLALPDDILSGANLYAVQKTFDGPFSFDVYYQSSSANTRIDANSVSAGLKAFKSAFTERFETIFPVPAKYQAFA